MYKKIVSAIILIAISATPFGQMNAQEVDSQEALVAQVAALQKYIERNFVSHENKTLSVDQLREIVKNGTQWMTNSQEDNGHFAYEYDVYADSYLDDDHIVRQGGSLYELGEIARRDPENKLKTHEAIENAIAYFDTHTVIVKDADGKSFGCIADTTRGTKCRLGATALAVMGMLGYVEDDEDLSDIHDESIESYMKYIMAMKKEGEGFRDVWQPESTARLTKESSFSNGEALLALVRYYQYNPQNEVKEMIDDTFRYLESKEEFETPLYLWIMAALKDMQKLWPDERYVAYSQKFTEVRRASLARLHYTNKNYCATTEGLVSAYSVLDGNVPEQTLMRLHGEIDFWNTHNSVLQIGSVDQYRLVTTDGAFQILHASNLDQAIGGFLTSRDVRTQRIDYTQHCVSTYLQTLVDIEGKKI